MPSFSKSSMDKLTTCHALLQDLFNEVIKRRDCSVICGFRGQQEQDEAKRTGKSKAGWGESKHNYSPSLAADVIPYPVKWEDKNEFMDFADFVKETAHNMGIPIRWGGDFTNFWDAPHYELVGEYSDAKVPT